MAEALLLSAAKVILNGLLSSATNEIGNQISLQWGFKKDLEKLRERLKMVEALFHDAENRKITSHTLMEWLKQLKDTVSDADDVLDELAYEALRRNIEVQNRKRDKVRNLLTLSDPLFHFKMAKKVDDLNNMLDRICKAGKDVGLEPAKQLNDAIVEPREFRMTSPFIDDSLVVGRDGDVSVLVDMLLGSGMEGELPMTAIVGMGGLGKTTLARVVYKEAKVLKGFGEERIWICVSDDFKVGRLLNQMVESLTGDKCETSNIEGLVRKLRQKLNGKKYLLVLDDVWNTNPHLWEELRNSLIGIGGAKESKILVTTRSKDVSLAMGAKFPLYAHPMTALSEADCWTMFRRIAFSNGGPSETQTLLDIGQRMVKKCKGVPLAINSLGGLLYSKQDEQEWKIIEKSEIWNAHENKNGVLPTLMLSFDHLPSPSLKRCFAFCSIFPKDKVIEKDRLIQLWVALGYLQPSSQSNMHMEELGNEYVKILLHNSLFQEVEHDEYNNIMSFKMHDLVHDLALQVSEGNSLTLKTSVVKNNPDLEHLSLFLGKETQSEFLEENVGKLRTLFVTGDLLENDKLKFQCLRALYFKGSKLPSEICKSIHLRFLDISKSSITEVPNFITKLYTLETLKLPNHLKELPNGIHNLVSLRHLYPGELTPKNIGQLTSLQTLPIFSVSEKSGHRIEELGKLSKLKGTIEVRALQYVKNKEEAEMAKIFEKFELQELALCWDVDLENSNNNHEDVLEGLKPHSNVKGLQLIGFGGRRLASWMIRDASTLQNLVKVVIEDCRLCEQVPALGRLTHLATLRMSKLHNLKRIGAEFYGLDEGILDSCNSSGLVAVRLFPTLTEFTLSVLDELEEWSDVSSSPAIAMSKLEFFPRLQKLEINDCPMLITIPALKGWTSLQRLQITDCPELSSLPGELLQPTLKEIYLWRCPKLNTPNPDALCSLTSLVCLVVLYCPIIGTCWEEGLFCTSSLQTSLISGLREESTRFPWPSTTAATTWCHFSSLDSLSLYDDGLEDKFESLPDQLEHLPSLRFLMLWNFSGLKSLPDWLGNLSSLECFVLKDCPQLSERCKEGGEDWHKIAHIPTIEIDPDMDVRADVHPLHADGDLENSNNSHEHVLEGLKPHSNVKGLQLIRLGGRRLASWMGRDTRTLQNLVDVVIENCTLCVQVPALGHLPHLATLRMSKLHNLKRIGAEFYGLDEGILDSCNSSGPVAVRVFPALTEFKLSLMDELKEWSDVSSSPTIAMSKLEFFPRLQNIEIINCPKLITIPALKGWTSLQYLKIEDCYKLSSLPGELLQPTLEVIDLGLCPKLNTPNPDALRSLTSLMSLTLLYCPMLGTCWEQGLFCTSSLQSLAISGFRGESFPWPSTSAASGFRGESTCFPWPSTSAATPWCQFSSLEFLGLLDGGREDKFESLPDQLEHLPALRFLKLEYFSGLKSLPDWLGNLSPLLCLLVCGCPHLSERCKEGGEDWHKIAHIPSICIDSVDVRTGAPLSDKALNL